MKYLNHKKNFLAIEEAEFSEYTSSKYVIQSAPYEYTSSYLAGSKKGPEAILKASQYVELYDEELNQESYKIGGICTLHAIDFEGIHNLQAVKLIEKKTAKLLKDGKFPITLGSEHTITLGTVMAMKKYLPDICVLQIDAHSDLRNEYHHNPFSHASVMARVHDLEVPLTQIGIRAQCKEEADLIKSSDIIHTFYIHDIRKNQNWIKDAVKTLGKNVYITIDADGFDPSIVPSVGTAEPNGLFWNESIELLSEVFKHRNVMGFDVVEIAPSKGSILSEYTMAKLIYKLIGYHTLTAKK